MLSDGASSIGGYTKSIKTEITLTVEGVSSSGSSERIAKNNNKALNVNQFAIKKHATCRDLGSSLLDPN